MNKDLQKLVAATMKKSPKLIRDVKEAGRLKRIQLDSPQLNFIFGGAFTIGRTYHIFGPFSGGKTSLVNYLAGQLQKKLPLSPDGQPDQNVVIFVDFERSFVEDFAAENGLLTDTDHLIFMQPDDIETFVDAIIPMIETGTIAAIILDSEAAAPTKTEMVDPTGKATFGGGAKAMAQSLRKLNIKCANYNTTYFVISQERANMNAYSHLPSVTGGTALPFYASWRGRVTKVETIETKDDTIGIHMRIKNYKNKVGVPFRTAEVDMYYKGGFKPDAEYFDFFLRFGIIKQAGAYFKADFGTEGSFSVQGRDKAMAWLKKQENAKLYERMKRMVDENLAKKNEELDANNVDPEKDPDDEIAQKLANDDATNASLMALADKIDEDIDESVMDDEVGDE
jgi:protein RecA